MAPWSSSTGPALTLTVRWAPSGRSHLHQLAADLLAAQRARDRSLGAVERASVEVLDRRRQEVLAVEGPQLGSVDGAHLVVQDRVAILVDDHHRQRKLRQHRLQLAAGAALGLEQAGALERLATVGRQREDEVALVGFELARVIEGAAHVADYFVGDRDRHDEQRAVAKAIHQLRIDARILAAAAGERRPAAAHLLHHR